MQSAFINFLFIIYNTNVSYKKFFLVICFSLFLYSCHKSAIGLRGISGLGTSMTEGGLYVEKPKTIIKVFDAHAYFENENDELAIQPTSGMEIEFNGGNVRGAAIHMVHRRFYPRLIKNSFSLVICGLVTADTNIQNLDKSIKENKIGCLKTLAGKENIINPKMYKFYELASKYRIPFIFDTSNCDGLKINHDFKINEVAKAYPRANFIVSHLGGKWHKETLIALESNNNVYVDTSICDDVSKMSNLEINEKVLENLVPFLKYPQKVVFGSGWPHTRIPKLVEVIEKVVPEQFWQTIFYENGYNLFILRSGT